MYDLPACPLLELSDQAVADLYQPASVADAEPTALRSFLEEVADMSARDLEALGQTAQGKRQGIRRPRNRSCIMCPDDSRQQRIATVAPRKMQHTRKVVNQRPLLKNESRRLVQQLTQSIGFTEQV